MRKLAFALFSVTLIAGATLERRVSLIDESRILPSEHPAIDYWNAAPTDAVARLQERLRTGDAALKHDDRFGYLPAVLEALDVPVSSQVLVFSKTSFQAVRIFPRVPRAIYHSDHVAVGFVRGGDVVEVASLDPKLGVVFYTLDQTRTSKPRFALRTTACISCHVGPATLGVPGLMVRSVHPDRFGVPERSPSFITDHRSPIEERWGGWYVSGDSGGQRHSGNMIFDYGKPSPLLNSISTSVPDLKPYVSDFDYLRANSDIVSLMTLEHQTRMTNLIVRLGYETRIAIHDNGPAQTLADLPEESRNVVTNTAEELLRYMLFTDEALLEAPIHGDPRYAADFEARGRKDSRGRSLRQLDLNRRLLRYPCSYMIYSEAFEALPDLAKQRVYRRLWEVLTGQDDAPEFSRLSTDDRGAIREILLDTQQDLPAYWRADSKPATP